VKPDVTWQAQQDDNQQEKNIDFQIEHQKGESAWQDDAVKNGLHGNLRNAARI
jgi:hypothetical protein